MAERSRDLGTCRALVAAEKAHAEAEHGAALRVEREAETARAAADDAVETAAVVWRERVGPGFDPALSALYAREVIACIRDAEVRRAALAEAQEARKAAAADWRRREAETSVIGSILSLERRRQACKREERSLAWIGDRLTFAWSDR